MAYYNITILPEVILGVFVIIAVVTFLISVFLYMKYGFQKNLKSETFLITLLIIFCFYIYAMQALVGNAVEWELFLFMIIAAISFNLCLYAFVIKYNNSKMIKFLEVLLIYIFVLLLGSFVFGLYFCAVFKKEYNAQLEMISYTNNMYKQAAIYAEIGLSGFFNFPNEGIIDGVSILQYFWGKVLDLGFFGYIVAEISTLFVEKKKRLNRNRARRIVK